MVIVEKRAIKTTRYQVGRNFEYKTKHYLEENGYWCLRSAGSHGLADIVAIKPRGIIALVQCKREGVISRAEKRELYDLAKRLGAIPVLASNTYGGVIFKKLVEHKPIKDGPTELLAVALII